MSKSPQSTSPLVMLPIAGGIAPLTLGLASLAVRLATTGTVPVVALYLLGVGAGWMTLGCAGVRDRPIHTFLYFTLFAAALASLIVSGCLLALVVSRSSAENVFGQVSLAVLCFMVFVVLVALLRRMKR